MAYLVVGGTRGIGRKVCQRLIASGHQTFVGYSSDEESAEAVRKEATEAQWPLSLVKADMSQREGCDVLVNAIVADGCDLDGLVYCAADPCFGSVSDWDAAAVTKSLQVNTISFGLLLQGLAPRMTGGAAAVYVSGAAAARAIPGFAALGIGKAASEQLVRYLAQEYAARHIRVNCVRSGQVDSETYWRTRSDETRKPAAATLFGRPLQADDVADAIVMMLSPEGGMVTGQLIAADGGLTLR